MMRLPYSQFRDYVRGRDGDMMGFSGTAYVSKGIEYWTGSNLSHVGCIRWDMPRLPGEFERLALFEATVEKGCTPTPLSIVCKSYWDAGGKCYWFQLNGWVKDKGPLIAAQVRALWGRPYSKIEYIGYASRLYRWIFPGDLDEHGLVCSEALAIGLGPTPVHEGLKAAGLWTAKEPWHTNPEDLVRSGIYLEPVEIVADTSSA